MNGSFNFFKKIGYFICGQRFMAISLLVVVSLFLGFWAMQSKVDNSIAVYQSENDPNWLQYKQFIEKYQVDDPLFIYLPNALPNGLEELADSIRKIRSVAHVIEVEVKPLTGGSAGLISIIAKHGSSPKELAALLKDLKKFLNGPFASPYHLGGVWFLTDRLDSLSARSTQTFFPVVIAILFVGVVVIMKGVRNVLLVMICGLLPGLHLTGLMSLAGLKLNMILLALPPLTMILGMSHAIHLLTKQKIEVEQQPMDIFAQVASPCLLSGLTTIIGFLSLTLSSYHPVQQLGVWGATGAGLSLLTSFMLLPHFLVPTVFSGKSPKTQRWITQLDSWKYTVVIALLLVVAVMAFGVTHLQKGTMILDFFTDDSSIRNDYRVIEGAGIGLTPFEVDLSHGKGISAEDLQEKLKILEKQHPEITHFIYIFASDNVVPVATNNGAPMLTPAGFDFILEDVQRLTIFFHTLSSEKTLELVEKTEEFFQGQLGKQEQAYVTGSVPLYAMGQKQLFSTLVLSFSVAFFSITIIMGIVLRSWRLGLLAIIPNFLPVLLILGVMGWAAIPLSVTTVTVASIVFGIVVDDTIHFLHSWKEKLASEIKVSDRLLAVIQHVGPAMITTTVVAGTGFLGFIASPFLPLRNFGLLISMALWLALCCDLILLPALLLLAPRQGSFISEEPLQ